MKGHVYLLAEVDQNGQEKYKIGVTKNNPSERVSKLKTGNSNDLFLIRSYESENYRKIERWLHKKYSSQRTLSQNEFFYLENSQVINFIEDCKQIDGIVTLLKKENPFYK
jgi:hypothetical protein